MNNYKKIRTEYLKPSTTIETVLVTRGDKTTVFFVYNYEGNFFGVCKDCLSLINYIQNKSVSDYHFTKEFELDNFFNEVEI